MEGIHALNPILMPPATRKAFIGFMRVCIPITLWMENVLLSRQDIRLIRRLVRDLKFRASPVQVTFDMWDQVCEGEKKYITPYRELADAQIDTLHLYEPCVFHHFLVPLREQVLDAIHRKKLDSLCRALELIEDIDAEEIPKESLLREFIGV